MNPARGISPRAGLTYNCNKLTYSVKYPTIYIYFKPITNFVGDTPMIILGLDPGLATMGYGVIEKQKNDNTVAVDYGVVLTPKEESLPVRLAMLEEGVNKILTKYKPDEIAVEELFFSKNITTGIPVAHARGVMLLTCIKYCGRLFEYTPNQIKQSLTGYGKADKIQMQHVVTSLLHLQKIPRPDDAADALAVALCHAHTSRFGKLYGIK